VNWSTANESRSALEPSAEDSRVRPSTIGTILIGYPSMVTSNWKSTAYTRFRCIRDYGRWCGGAAVAIVPAALWHSKPFVRAKGIAFSRD
jgi:hypothetical protein